MAELFSKLIQKPALWTHFPAGAGKLSKATAGRLKGYGLRAGMPDYLVMFDGRTVWFELKTIIGRPSKVQVATHLDLKAAGAAVYVCRSIDEVVRWLAFEQIPMYMPLANAFLKGSKEWRPAGNALQPAETSDVPAPAGGASADD